MDIELKKEVELVLYENQEIAVNNKDEYVKAGDVLKLIKNKIKKIEDKRVEYTKPLLDQKKLIDDDFKKMQAPLNELVRKISSVMVNWNIAEQKRLDEEQKRIEAEAMAEAKKNKVSEVIVPIINEKIKSTRGDIATSTMIEDYDFELEDITKVPLEYLIVNETKVRGDIKASKGKLIIPGIKNITTHRINSR